MSKTVVAVLGLLLGVASMSFAEEPVTTFRLDGMVDPYAGPTPAGMRFGDVGQYMAMQTGDIEGPAWQGGCSMCCFGVHGVPCDPDWAGPCVDWKLIGWYSNFHDKDELWCEKGHCGWGCGRWCGRRCGGCCACRTCCE